LTFVVVYYDVSEWEVIVL